MTKEQLEKGQKLVEEIQELSKTIDRWNNLNRIEAISINYCPTYRGSIEKKVLNYIDTERIKQEAVSNMKTRIAELEKELKEL